MSFLRARSTAAVLGATAWTATEYGLHRFAMHEMRGKGLASREHLKHHADVTYFSPTPKKLLSAAVTASVAYPAAAATVDRRWGRVFTSSMIGTYFAYEIAHRRIHTHPPRNRYGRWSRRSHLNHHFGAPMRNFGVTSSLWDQVTGTYVVPGRIVVPRRMAPVWMLDETGEVRPEFADDYVAKGAVRRAPDTAERDRTDAFANIAPEA